MRTTESFSYGAPVTSTSTESQFFQKYIHKATDACCDPFYFVIISQCLDWAANEWQVVELRQTFQTIEAAEAKAKRVIIALMNGDIELCPDEVAF